jgi:pimeloyl-ACP methyl ester carboxylesterase
MDVRDEFDRLEARLYDEYGLERRVSWHEVRVPERLRIRVVETGSGRPVVFVHGGGGFGATFVPLVARLGSLRAIVVDRPGFGLSEGTGLARIDLRRHAVGFLEAVLDAVGVPTATLVGTSMGGLWTAWLTLDRAERVERLGLLACPALALGTSGQPPLRLIGKPAIGRRMLHIGPRGRAGAVRTLRVLGEPQATIDRLPPAFLDLMGVSFDAPTFDDSWIGLLSNALTLRGANPAWALGEREVGAINRPVLLAWGSNDPFGSLDVARRFAALTSGRLLELDGAGHLPWLDAPECVAAGLAAFIGADEHVADPIPEDGSAHLSVPA